MPIAASENYTIIQTLSLVYFWGFLSSSLEACCIFFLACVLGKYSATFNLEKDAPQFQIVLCLVLCGQSNIIITTSCIFCMGKENYQNPLPKQL